MLKIQNKPLVSIIVITYNSSNYVIETLESIKKQTYQNIELIVSDDCSTDDTVEICRNWMVEHKERFIRTELLIIPNNTGISANCNRGIKVAHGVWVKLIAGDDTLLSNCISSNISYIMTHPMVSILQSNAVIYDSFFNDDRQINISNIANIDIFNKKHSPLKQYKLLLRRNQIIATAIFIKRDIFKMLGGFDEELKLIEDYPFWLKATQAGFRIDAFNEITVNYRLNSSCSSSRKNSETFMSSEYAKCLLLFNSKYRKDNVNKLSYYLYNLGLKLTIYFNLKGLNKNNILGKFLYRVFIPSIMRFPFLYIEKI
ncbi:glycosyltransferase [Candidatus Neomarinimicrobiota bacterium]